MIFTSHSIFYENMMYDNSCTKVNQFFFFLRWIYCFIRGSQKFVKEETMYFIEFACSAIRIIWNSRCIDNLSNLFCSCNCDLGELF